jgi:hypothetical protein
VNEVVFQESNELFFSSFDALEAGQIACVHDFLLEFTTDAFFTECECDVEWNSCIMRPAPGVGVCYSETQEYMVSQGLQYLRHIAVTKTQEENCRYIADHECPSGFFNDAFSRLHHEDLSLPQPVTGENRPLLAWEKALELWGLDRIQAQYLRSWGYCLWDSETLQRLNYWTETNQIMLRAEQWATLRWAELRAALERTNDSQDARELIYHRGGTGWYTANDMKTCNIKWIGGDERYHTIPLPEVDWAAGTGR